MARRFDADAFVERALKKERKGDREAAEALYREVVRRSPRHVGAHTQLGGLLAQEGRLAEAVGHLEAAGAAMPAEVSIWNNLGHVYRELGRLDDARAAFGRVIDLAPVVGHYGLGTVLQKRGELEAARDSYQKAVQEGGSGFPLARQALATVHELTGRPELAIRELTELLADAGPLPGVRRRLGVLHAFHGTPAVALAMLAGALQDDPGDAIAHHMIASLEGRPSDRPPPGFVAAVFDAYADGYDTHLRDVLQTRVPTLIAEALPDALGDVLDLGCGTGMSLMPLRHRLARAVGVDASPRMVETARRSGLYDTVDCAGIETWLPAHEGTYDTVIAADVLVYLGDLDPVLEGVRRVCRGRFAFTFEDGGGGPYALQPTGRYAHGEGYVRAAAGRAGFQVVSLERADLRRERAGWVPGWVALLEPCI